MTISALLLGACSSSAAQSDLSSVRKLSGVQQLPAPRQSSREEADEASDPRALLARPLAVEDAVRIALSNNRELRARLRELGIARSRLTQASMVANPVFEAELLPERDSEVELRVEYEITSLIMAPQRRRAELHDLEAARLEAAAAVVQLGYTVRSAFYALQAAEQRLMIAQHTLDALAAGRDAAVALLEAGNVPPLDASRNIAAFERARITVAQVELELMERREAMHRLLGVHGEATGWKLASLLPPAPDELRGSGELEKRAIEASLELKAARKRLDALAKRTGVARTAGWLPEVAVDVHSLKTNAEEGEGGDEWRWGGGVSVEVPLFDHGQGERRGYEAQFDALLERYQGLAVELRSRAREARSRLVSAHARARQYQSVIVPAQQTVLEQTLLQYNAMQLGVFELLEARRGLLDLELAQVDTLREYWTAASALEALLAGARVDAGSSSSSPAALGGAPSASGGH